MSERDREPPESARARAEAQARVMAEHAAEEAKERRRMGWLRRLAELVIELLR